MVSKCSFDNIVPVQTVKWCKYLRMITVHYHDNTNVFQYAA